MPFIKVIEENDASGRLKEIYNEVKQKRGKLSNILKIQSLLPETIYGHLAFYTSVMFSGTALNREQKELIATVVSALNKCSYCVNHHSEALLHYWKDESKVKLAAEDYHQLKLSEKESAMLGFAEKLTLNNNEMAEEDVLKLKESGFTDEEILTIALVTGYFNFVNRIANALGVEFSEDEKKGYKY
ncbi:MAG: peroxidase-related enzyme [Ignavibacteriaceae bacterium]